MKCNYFVGCCTLLFGKATNREGKHLEGRVTRGKSFSLRAEVLRSLLEAVRPSQLGSPIDAHIRGAQRSECLFTDIVEHQLQAQGRTVPKQV